jgi:hypothetical protein
MEEKREFSLVAVEGTLAAHSSTLSFHSVKSVFERNYTTYAAVDYACYQGFSLTNNDFRIEFKSFQKKNTPPTAKE